MAIKFGTDGWRAVISDEFTFANVTARRAGDRRGVDRVVPCLRPHPAMPAPPCAVVGFDTRFLSDRYAIAVSEVLAANGLRVAFGQGRCPHPRHLLLQFRTWARSAAS